MAHTRLPAAPAQSYADFPQCCQEDEGAVHAPAQW
jgi:hypothetical protein